MKFLSLIVVTLFLSHHCLAEQMSCKELIKKAVALSQATVKNVNAVQGNLLIEAKTIRQWANVTDLAFKNGISIPTSGMRVNAAELQRQAGVLGSFTASIETEIQSISIDAIECE